MIACISSNVNYYNKQEALVRLPETELFYKIMCIFILQAIGPKFQICHSQQHQELTILKKKI